MESTSNKKALVIINPGAGLSIKQSVISNLVSAKLEGLGFKKEIFILDRNFENQIANYDFFGMTLVVAVGGDGTVKVAARIMLQNNITAPLAIIPFGSANVVAASVGIPVMVKPALKLLDNYSTTKIDVGVINNLHYFLVGFSIGWVSLIVTSTPQNLKRRFGFLSYLIKFLFNKIKIRKIKFKISTQNKTFWVKGNSLIIFNAFNYFGLKPKKKIDIRDGIFNLYVFTNRRFLALFEAMFYMLWYQRPPRHIFSLDNNYFKINLNYGLKTCQIDGDYIKLAKEMEIKVLPRAISVVVPNK